ncbi:hypothetical protein [Evansella cellulosilytica]|uniref:Lipoprotein n=1 Tax=Evansella cellulosilytica (strain ATCC 21833 / DSM 2522 / FERM P-1141 / JCM 9156 / N-4) TaxID=649639 RepID=E6TWK6_EVAC2|nr:hypothetical protein [Evansella cellulosilytica]ADU32269.1 hypothetical protein Bcell_4038 [Evansella cellulosilytica DSM 2522]
MKKKMFLTMLASFFAVGMLSACGDVEDGEPLDQEPIDEEVPADDDL